MEICLTWEISIRYPFFIISGWYPSMYVCVYVCKYGWIYVCMYVCMYVWMDGCMDEVMPLSTVGDINQISILHHLINKDGTRLDGWTDGCMHAWMDGWMDVCVYVCMHRWRYASLHSGRYQSDIHSSSSHQQGWYPSGWMDGWIDAWMDGWMDGWMNGWMDEWMDEVVSPYGRVASISRWRYGTFKMDVCIDVCMCVRMYECVYVCM